MCPVDDVAYLPLHRSNCRGDGRRHAGGTSRESIVAAAHAQRKFTHPPATGALVLMLVVVAAAVQSVVSGWALSGGGPPLLASAASRVRIGSIRADDWDWDDDIESSEVYERWRELGLLDLEEVPGGLPKRQGEYTEELDADDDTTPQMMVAASNKVRNAARSRAGLLNVTDAEDAEMSYLDLLMRDGGSDI